MSVSVRDARVVERAAPVSCGSPGCAGVAGGCATHGCGPVPDFVAEPPRAPSRLDRLLRQETFSDADIVTLLGLTDPADCEALRRAAFDLTSRVIGDAVHYRGLIEFSNVCRLNCRYCGIREANRTLPRYMLSKERIVESALWAAANGYGSVCLQSGERRDARFVRFVEDCVREIRLKSASDTLPYGLGITLSLGEQDSATYRRWREAAGEHGGVRYLMRMETTNPNLFATLHPKRDRKRTEKAFESRVRALDDIRAAGMQVGTGGMIGLPGQTLADLCADIRFYSAHDVDMLGMGPYITSVGADMVADGMMEKRALMQLSLNMLAAARLVLRDVNLAASTALQTLFEDGRERGVSYGANIVMPNVSPREVRKNYQLYDDKPCVDEERDDCRGCLEGRIAAVGRRVGWNEWGCSPHFQRRTAALP